MSKRDPDEHHWTELFIGATPWLAFKVGVFLFFAGLQWVFTPKELR